MLLAIKGQGPGRARGAVRRATLAALAFAGAAAMCAPAGATAASLEVTTTADPGSGSCDVAECTLREAIAMAEANSEADTISFADGVSGTIQLTSALPELKSVLRIEGPGASLLRIKGESSGYRILTIASGADVGVSGLTITGGEANEGGGIRNAGTLRLNEVVVRGNAATGLDSANGGGILNSGGVLTVTASTIADNEVTGLSEEIGAGFGGGIMSRSGGTVVLQRSTVSGNRAAGDGGGRGGGVVLFSGSSHKIESTTFAGNQSLRPGGGGIGASLAIVSATARIQNSILSDADPDSDTCFVQEGAATLTSLGHNLAADASCGLDATGDRQSTDPALLPLAANRGPTPTHAFAPGAPPHDQGDSAGLTLDQRGFDRVFDDSAVANEEAGDGADIGAFELQPFQLEVNSTVDPGTGDCDAAECTLREAIAIAGAHPLPDEITFAPGVTGTIQLTSGLPELTGELTIDGPGADLLAVKGEGAADPYRIFTLDDTADVEISGLEITGGEAGIGGGILNTGKLRLVNALVTGNRATGANNPPLPPTAWGGGIYSLFGELTVVASTIADNVAKAGVAGGGGIAVTDGPLTLLRSTVSGNRVIGQDAEVGDSAFGGGIYISAGEHRIASVTFSGNEAVGGSSGGLGASIHQNAVSATIQNSILAEDDADSDNCTGLGPLTSLGHNLASDEACGFHAPGDRSSVDPGLKPLALNGGTTPTHAFAPESPARDRGDSGELTSDQTGGPRVFDDPHVKNSASGDGADVGALELTERLPLCGGKPATITGSHGADVLVGTPGRDVIAGRGGDDVIRGAGGADVICGGRGDNVLRGGAGADKIHGRLGRDELIGGRGRDWLAGGRGADRLLGGPGADELRGRRGRDELRGGPGRDVLRGGPGRDSCRSAADHRIDCER